MELTQVGDHLIGNHEVMWAVEQVPPDAREILKNLPWLERSAPIVAYSSGYAH